MEKFDADLVSQLAEKDTSALTLVVLHEPEDNTGKQIAELQGVADVETLDQLGATRVIATKAALREMATWPEILRIGLDYGGGGHMSEARPLTDVSLVNDLGFSGAGAKIVVIDSGLDSDHPDLSDRLIGEYCDCPGCCPSGGSTQEGTGAAEDDHGHGTNVSGILAGSGVLAEPGVAFSADIVAIKILDDQNRFQSSFQVSRALEWIANNHPDAAVVNMSLGTDARYSGNCDSATASNVAMARAVERLAIAGVQVFASSGNRRASGEMEAPACLSQVIAVGAVWDAALGSQTQFGCTDMTAPDLPTCFSNISATTDLLAPGAAITSSGRGGGLSTFRGTSQASPHAAGCAAVLAAAVPELPVSLILPALRRTGPLIAIARASQTIPRIDCGAALNDLLDVIFAADFGG